MEKEEISDEELDTKFIDYEKQKAKEIKKVKKSDKPEDKKKDKLRTLFEEVDDVFEESKWRTLNEVDEVMARVEKALLTVDRTLEKVD